MGVRRAMFTQTTPHDPASQYIAPDAEWTALQTLAAEASPARAVAQGDWRADYFASPGASEAFAQLTTAESPILITPPTSAAASHDGVTGMAGGGALDAADLANCRMRLVALTQARVLATWHYNIAARLRALDPLGDLGQVGALATAASRALESVTSLGGTQRVASATLGTLTAGYWDRVSQRALAMPTGLAALDEALGGGLQAGRLITLLGAPGSGKTTLANQWAEHIADAGRPVVYLTLEDAPDTLLAKTMARVGGLDYSAALHGYATQRAAITQALATVAGRRSATRLLYVEDVNGLTLADVKSIAVSHFARYGAQHAAASGISGLDSGGAGVLVVDYLQRLARAQRGPDARDDLRIIVGKLTEDLRGLGRELGCCVVAIASMNRASGYGKAGDVSVLASAKEAGDIEYTADVLMALTDASDDAKARVGLKHEARLLRIDKNRLGEASKKIILDWYPARQQFTEVSDR